jgi:ferredoxin
MRVCHNSDIIECLGEIMDSKMLTVELDGGLFEATCGDNLLELLLSKGAYVRHGCRAGACGACRLYDQTNCESILSCQTSVASAMSLTTHAPSVFSDFSVLSKTILNDANVDRPK